MPEIETYSQEYLLPAFVGRSLRRWPIYDLLYYLQDCKIDYEQGKYDTPEMAKLEYFKVEEIQEELERRKRFKLQPDIKPHEDMVNAVKKRADIVEILSHYTDVFTHKRQWTFRCTLHGEDKHPSGLIYPDKQRFWCPVCQVKGTVIDVVMLFGKTDIRGAIEYLCKFYGLQPDIGKEACEIST